MQHLDGSSRRRSDISTAVYHRSSPGKVLRVASN
jgi:hypothetical protein